MPNKQDPYNIAELIFREMKNGLSEKESIELAGWKNKDPRNMELYARITNGENIREKINLYEQTDTGNAWDRLEKQLAGNSKVISRNFRAILPYAAAACILVLVGTYFLLKPSQEPTGEKLAENPVIVSGTQKAILTTSDNKKIVLGDTRESQTFSLEKALVKDTNNTLTYLDREPVQSGETPSLAMNTLETPRGGEYSLVLSDGTRVFLNAETRLTFPEVFADDVREVILEGEAYFEVTGSGTKAFIIKTFQYDVSVYGTSFNVSAYPADGNSHTTLVSGSVGIRTAAGAELRLIPGEQAFYSKEDSSLVSRKVDTDVYTSWKDGKFMFMDESLEEIMRRLERWYNTETVYLDEGVMERHFTGTLDRYDRVEDILDKIALAARIEFRLVGNTIYVDKKEN